MSTAELLATCWGRWADDLSGLLDAHWRLPTRCEGWDVMALAAHVAPDVDALRDLPSLDQPAAVDDAAALLRGFNVPGGVAHEMAGKVLEAARRGAEELAPVDIVGRFRDAADWVTTMGRDPSVVVPHPVVGSVTTRVMLEVGVVEAVVHHKDLRDAVPGEPMSEEARQRAAEILVRVADVDLFIDAATGRAPARQALPVMR